MRATVVICTMPSRQADLRRCLDSLGRADLAGNAEILVVLRRGDVVGDLPQNLPNGLPVWEVRSRTQGLSDKRNAGLQAARGAVVAYLDDDARVPADYFRELRRAFSGEADAVAGAVEPEFEGDLPGELRPVAFRIGGFNCWEGKEKTEARVGAHCAFRRAFLEGLGPFDVRLGPGGTYLPWGDDSEMFRRAASRGKVVFGPAWRVRHRIQADRLSWAYLRRRIYRTGRVLCVMDRIHGDRFLSRSAMVPLFWMRSALRALARPVDREARLVELRYRGYLAQLLLLLVWGMPAR
jgi:glycosyltransferase involved in cell wall biosynthesis